MSSAPLHVYSLVLLSHYRKIEKATDVWEDILVENPMDMLSLKLLTDLYIFNGRSLGIRDSCARVLPYWKPETPYYGYVETHSLITTCFFYILEFFNHLN